MLTLTSAETPSHYAYGRISKQVEVREKIDVHVLEVNFYRSVHIIDDILQLPEEMLLPKSDDIGMKPIKGHCLVYVRVFDVPDCVLSDAS